MSLASLMVSPGRQGRSAAFAPGSAPRARPPLFPQSQEEVIAEVVVDAKWFFNKNMSFALASVRTTAGESDCWTAALAKSVDRDTDTVACLQCLYDIHMSAHVEEKDDHSQCFNLFTGDDRVDVQEADLWVLSSRDWKLFVDVVTETAKGIADERIVRALPRQLRVEMLEACKTGLTLRQWATEQLKRLNAEASKPALKPAAAAVPVSKAASRQQASAPIPPRDARVMPVAHAPAAPLKSTAWLPYGAAAAAVDQVVKFVASPSKANTPQCTALVSAGDKNATDELKRSEDAVRQQVLQCNAWKNVNDALGAATKITDDDAARRRLVVQALNEMMRFSLLDERDDAALYGEEGLYPAGSVRTEIYDALLLKEGGNVEVDDDFYLCHEFGDIPVKSTGALLSVVTSVQQVLRMEVLILTDLQGVLKRRTDATASYQVLDDPRAATSSMDVDGMRRGTVIVDEKHKQHVVVGASRAALKTGAPTSAPTSLVLGYRLGVHALFTNEKAVVAFVEGSVGVFRPPTRGAALSPDLLSTVTKGYLPLAHQLVPSVPETVIASALAPTIDYMAVTAGFKNYVRFSEAVFGLDDQLTSQFGAFVSYWELEMETPEDRPVLLEAYNLTADGFNKDLDRLTYRAIKPLGALASIATVTDALQHLELSSFETVFKANVVDARQRCRLVTSGHGMLVSLPGGAAGRGAGKHQRTVSFADGGMSVLAMLSGRDEAGDGTGTSPPPAPLVGKRKRPALKQQQKQQQQILKSNAATMKSNADVMRALQTQPAANPLKLQSMASKSAAGKDISGAGRLTGARAKLHKPTEDKPCNYFALGTCSWGTNCKYLHDTGAAATADKK